MQKGNPAAAIAIIASIFGAAGVVCLLPEAHVSELPMAQVLPSKEAVVFAAAPAAVKPLSPFVVRTIAVQSPVPTATPAVVGLTDSPSVAIPLEFSHELAPLPALQATHLSFLSAAAAPVQAEPVPQDDGWMGGVPAAFDRTGSALAFAFRKTGAGVKTALSVFTP